MSRAIVKLASGGGIDIDTAELAAAMERDPIATLGSESDTQRAVWHVEAYGGSYSVLAPRGAVRRVRGGSLSHIEFFDTPQQAMERLNALAPGWLPGAGQRAVRPARDLAREALEGIEMEAEDLARAINRVQRAIERDRETRG